MIVGPLVVVACVSSVVRYGQFTLLSRQLYDNALLTVALTISRDVTINEGDLLTKTVLDALARSLGDTVYYHLTGPDGAYVTGYSNAPPLPDGLHNELGKPAYFDAVYMGKPVRALYMTEYVRDLPDSGLVTMEVWQTINQRQQLSFSLLSSSAAYFAMLVLVAAIAVWFGIRRGLRPLEELEADISSRTPEDLQPISRIVPAEIGTVVSAMNSLFSRLTEAFAIRDAFISDAAHQMRTPVAGIQAQAEAALTARNEASLRERVTEVALAARRAGRLTHQLLSMERVRGRNLRSLSGTFDLEALVADTTRSFAERVLPKGIDVRFSSEGRPRPFTGDATLLREAILNLLENAEKYGNPDHPMIEVALTFHADRVELSVEDNGPGISQHAHKRVFDRFYRLAPESAVGCGLGLAIVSDVARHHGGCATVDDIATGCRIRVVLANAQ
ncbi:sensor histidine kinase [Rhizobium halophytocola]|uniref:histidine kinase n=1 Tax=Rhizobium halophytocola TaxID=735519 RepID=A0ABS4DUC6_9HYPH|nr:sensor histidine kinase [Rhizobium halophytocola]MBP1849262.1 two-component system sensor histidine kinase TctE [Rhizobium halophytocola]